MPWNYEPFSTLSPAEKQTVIANYTQKFRDFDNDIIVNSALEVLNANGHEDVHAIQVGPERRGDDFELFTQLFDKIRADKRYTIFSLPVYHGNHSVAVVLDNRSRECHVIDSLNQFYDEAKSQVQTAIELDLLPGYSIVTPSQPVVQQHDQWSCGIHSAANIVGIITGDINLKTNVGLEARTSTEVNDLLGIFSKAYENISHKRASELDEPRLNARQKKTLRGALDGMLKQPDLSPRVLADIRSLSDALLVETPLGLGGEELLRQRPIGSFLNEFKSNNPGNILVPLFDMPEFMQTLPATLQDNVELMEDNVTAFIGFQLISLQDSAQASHSGSERSVASSSTPVVAESVASSSTPVVAKEEELAIEFVQFLSSIPKDVRKGMQVRDYWASRNPDEKAVLRAQYEFENPDATVTKSHSNSERSVASSSTPVVAKEEELAIEFVQFLSSIPKDVRKGMQVRDYWASRNPDEKAVLRAQYEFENPDATVTKSHSNSERSVASSSTPVVAQGEELPAKFVQFLSSIPKDVRKGKQVRDYWASCNPEEKALLRDLYLQRKDVERCYGFFAAPSRVTSGIDNYLLAKAQDMGFESVDKLKKAIGAEGIEQIKTGFNNSFPNNKP